jgi:hypothetical protein
MYILFLKDYEDNSNGVNGEIVERQGSRGETINEDFQRKIYFLCTK